MKAISIFISGMLFSICSFGQVDMPDTTGMFRNETVDHHHVYAAASPKPQYPDDVADFLAGNLRYPKNLKDWRGAVYATFIVDSLGNILNPAFLKKSPNDPEIPKAIKDEYLDVINNGMARWRPGYVNGKPAYVRVFLQGVFFEPGM